MFINKGIGMAMALAPVGQAMAQGMERKRHQDIEDEDRKFALGQRKRTLDTQAAEDAAATGRMDAFLGLDLDKLEQQASVYDKPLTNHEGVEDSPIPGMASLMPGQKRQVVDPRTGMLTDAEQEVGYLQHASEAKDALRRIRALKESLANETDPAKRSALFKQLHPEVEQHITTFNAKLGKAAESRQAVMGDYALNALLSGDMNKFADTMKRFGAKNADAYREMRISNGKVQIPLRQDATDPNKITGYESVSIPMFAVRNAPLKDLSTREKLGLLDKIDTHADKMTTQRMIADMKKQADDWKRRVAERNATSGEKRASAAVIAATFDKSVNGQLLRKAEALEKEINDPKTSPERRAQAFDELQDTHLMFGKEAGKAAYDQTEGGKQKAMVDISARLKAAQETVARLSAAVINSGGKPTPEQLADLKTARGEVQRLQALVAGNGGQGKEKKVAIAAPTAPAPGTPAPGLRSRVKKSQ